MKNQILYVRAQKYDSLNRMRNIDEESRRGEASGQVIWDWEWWELWRNYACASLHKHYNN